MEDTKIVDQFLERDESVIRTVSEKYGKRLYSLDYSIVLEKENSKFQYKEVEKGGRAQKYLSSVEWLIRANIVVLSHAVTDICYDLTDYLIDTNFRAYTSDMTFIITMRDYSIKQEIILIRFLFLTDII